MAWKSVIELLSELERWMAQLADSRFTVDDGNGNFIIVEGDVVETTYEYSQQGYLTVIKKTVLTPSGNVIKIKRRMTYSPQGRLLSTSPWEYDNE